ncbi:hypothetical protein [Leucobacter sp. W1478]|uniref:hypothetical protein n=1 Tax=Leucobacter sp. W1478 TaxID=3439065 RepID=UPI003F2B96BB
MTTQLELTDHQTRDDLRVFLERLQRAGQPEVRLVTRGSAVAVYGCIQAPAGLLDSIPVVLGMRAFGVRPRLATPTQERAQPAGVLAPGLAPGVASGSQLEVSEIDVTVSGRALLDRIARMGLVGLRLELPDMTVSAAWAGILPPTSGWQPVGAIDAPSLVTVAQEGIARVSGSLPADAGDPVVRQVRRAVWGAEIAPGVPAAAAFAAEVLGFLSGEPVATVASTLTWTRLSTSRGHVLVRNFLG